MREFLDRFVGNISIPALLVSTCFWSWFDLVPLSPLLFSVAGAEACARVPAMAFVVGAAVLALIASNARLRARTLNPRFFALVSLLLGSLGTAVIHAGAVCGSPAVWLLGAVIAGAYEGVGVAVVGCLTVCQGKTNALIHLVACLPLNIVFVLLGMFLQPMAAVALCMLLPMFSALSFKVFLERGRNAQILARVAQKPRQAPVAECDACEPRAEHDLAGFMQGRAGYVVPLLVITVAFGFVNCRTMFVDAAFVPELFAGYASLVIRAVVSVWVFIEYVFRSRYPYTLLVTAVLLMSVGLFALGFATSAGVAARMVACTLFYAGYAVFDLLIWAVLVVAHRGSHMPIQQFVYMAYAFDQLGNGVGAFLGDLSLGRPTLSLVFNMAGVALVLLAFVVLNTRSALRDDLHIVVVAAPSEATSSCDVPVEESRLVETPRVAEPHCAEASRAIAAASRYFLTQREADVLALLLAGRSVPYISDQLTVSQNTVKTHVRHIYAKFDVHNRQELLDLLAQAETMEQ